MLENEILRIEAYLAIVNVSQLLAILVEAVFLQANFC